MDEIAYGVVREYPLPPLNQYWGELKSAKGNQCLDSMGHTQGGTVETYYCHQQGGNQVCHSHMFLKCYYVLLALSLERKETTDAIRSMLV